MYWDATYRVTTPLFLGGAYPETTAELRPSTIKGLLRFWFRAVALPQLGTLSNVKRLENDIFGSTDKQSSFYLTIHHQEGLDRISNATWGSFHGLRYLGYGVVDRQGQITRPYLQNDGTFTIRLKAKKDASKNAAYFLPLTLQALGFFGGAGSRSRKGFGSLSLEALVGDGVESWKPPATVEELKEFQRKLLQAIKIDKGNYSIPEYTAFSKNSHVWISGTGTDALTLLNELGCELMRYRSYGRESKGKHILPDNTLAEQNFADDHDLILDVCRGQQVTNHPRRVVFGLPHNYFFMSTREKVDVSPAHKDYSRRASPLFIHIHALTPGSYAAVLTLLPAVFLPPDVKISISSKFNKATVNCQVNYQDIIDFMNHPAFSKSKVVVWP